MIKSQKKIFESKLEDAKERVLQTAVNYVDFIFDDESTVKNLYQLTDLQIKLTDAVSRFQNIKKNYRAAKKTK